MHLGIKNKFGIYFVLHSVFTIFATMISKNRVKFIRSLEQRKYRREHGLFVVEGPKSVADMFGSFECVYVAATQEWLSQNELPDGVEVDEVTDDELRRASFQDHPQQVLTLFRIPSYAYSSRCFEVELCLALDNVQNPGNLGTIIRLADWFGIERVFCSSGTADVYNPKVVQAAMGSLARVKVHYVDLPALLAPLPAGVPVYGTFLDGENLYGEELGSRGLIVMGNEGNGISTEVEQYVTHRLTIPNYNQHDRGADSLNVAVATAVVCAEFRRRFGN